MGCLRQRWPKGVADRGPLIAAKANSNLKLAPLPSSRGGMRMPSPGPSLPKLLLTTTKMISIRSYPHNLPYGCAISMPFP
ncbi:hypothetical protein MN608_09983 [Microdochium nivale]|nr:hypothetical protein MN608_09983 [Microdochium nivale]